MGVCWITKIGTLNELSKFSESFKNRNNIIKIGFMSDSILYDAA